MTVAVRDIELPGITLYRRGKVRNMFDLGDQLLMVASDRVSAFDVVLPDPVPDKGRVLTQMSRFWFALLGEVVPNHLISTRVEDLPPAVADQRDLLRDRFMLVRKAERVDIECVVRGYIAGSAWSEYRRSGTVCGAVLEGGMLESAQFREPLFTPAIKVDEGHDENISFERMTALVGQELAAQLREASLRLYARAEQHARQRGIIIADTKFEFGLIDGQLTVIDEILTPDSSRFWNAATYAPGRSQASFDKQPLRDWLEQSGWDKAPPGPALPPAIIAETATRYRRAYEVITGMELSPS
jgi:phosphoribosylaminoimidazole-succinocarboxamide synthase